MLQWFSHVSEDIIFVLYLAPNEILCKTLIHEQNRNRAAWGEPRARSPEPDVFPWAVPGAHPRTLLPPGNSLKSLKSAAFKVSEIFSEEGPREWLAEPWNLLADERTFGLTI